MDAKGKRTRELDRVLAARFGRTIHISEAVDAIMPALEPLACSTSTSCSTSCSTSTGADGGITVDQ
jgi:hypothetical protein